MNVIRQINLTIDSSLKNVAIVGAAVNRLCALVLLSEDECADIELCVVEGVNNAVKHAYNSQSGNDVDIVFTIQLDRLVIEIFDSGKGMEIDEIEFPMFDFTSLDTIPESGMGLYIIKSIMDEIYYTREPNRNKLTMIRYLNPDAVLQFMENQHSYQRKIK